MVGYLTGNVRSKFCSIKPMGIKLALTSKIGRLISRKMLQKFSVDGIYNTKKTGLFYLATLDCSLYKHTKLSGSKKKDCITMLFCMNMSDSDKHKLLVMGKSAKPSRFK